MAKESDVSVQNLTGDPYLVSKNVGRPSPRIIAFLAFVAFTLLGVCFHLRDRDAPGVLEHYGGSRVDPTLPPPLIGDTNGHHRPKSQDGYSSEEVSWQQHPLIKIANLSVQMIKCLVTPTSHLAATGVLTVILMSHWQEFGLKDSFSKREGPSKERFLGLRR